MTKPIIGSTDALRINGQVFAFIASGAMGGRLVPLGGNSDEIHVTTEELTDLVRSGSAWVEHRYFSEGQAKRRAIAGHKVLMTLPASEREVIMWKARCCEVFLSAERAREVSRTDASFQAFFPDFQSPRLAQSLPGPHASALRNVFAGADASASADRSECDQCLLLAPVSTQ